MGQFSIYHWLIVLLILVLLFGARKIPALMKGLGEGVRNFKDAVAGGKGPDTTTPTTTQLDADKRKGDSRT